MKNVLFLDMDNVLNNSYLTRKWFDNKFQELESSLKYNSNEEIKEEARKQFSEFTCNYEEYIFPELASLLKEVIEEVDLKIIWSSTWRKLKRYDNIEDARKMFDRRGLIGKALIGYTPIFEFPYDCPNGSRSRIDEIYYFMNNNVLDITFNDRLAAIDDMNLSYLEKMNIKFFPTDAEFGITEKIKNDMIKYYKGK